MTSTIHFPFRKTHPTLWWQCRRHGELSSLPTFRPFACRKEKGELGTAACCGCQRGGQHMSDSSISQAIVYHKVAPLLWAPLLTVGSSPLVLQCMHKVWGGARLDIRLSDDSGVSAYILKRSCHVQCEPLNGLCLCRDCSTLVVYIVLRNQSTFLANSDIGRCDLFNASWPNRTSILPDFGYVNYYDHPILG